jgi:hypothetical protein
MPFAHGEIAEATAPGEFTTITYQRGKSLKEQGWKERVYNAPTSYKAVKEGGDAVLHAVSEGNASMIYKKVEYDPEEFPVIRWRWKAVELPRKEQQPGDDYGARLYVMFPGWTFLTSYVLEYVWDNDNPVGAVIRSKTSSKCKHIVVTSGREQTGEWVAVERNLVEDFKKAFGWEIDRRVGGIGIMTDSDNTASRAEAFYGPITITR